MFNRGDIQFANSMVDSNVIGLRSQTSTRDSCSNLSFMDMYAIDQIKIQINAIFN